MLKPGHRVESWKANLYSLSPWHFSFINICTHRFKTFCECWLIDTSFVGRVALLMTHIAKRIWLKEYSRYTSHPFPLGSQPLCSRVKELESGADRTHTGVLANRKCHVAHCVRHLKEPRGWAFRNAGSWQTPRRSFPAYSLKTQQHNTAQLLTASKSFNDLIRIKWSGHICLLWFAFKGLSFLCPTVIPVHY